MRVADRIKPANRCSPFDVSKAPCPSTLDREGRKPGTKLPLSVRMFRKEGNVETRVPMNAAGAVSAIDLNPIPYILLGS